MTASYNALRETPRRRGIPSSTHRVLPKLGPLGLVGVRMSKKQLTAGDQLEPNRRLGNAVDLALVYHPKDAVLGKVRSRPCGRGVYPTPERLCRGDRRPAWLPTRPPTCRELLCPSVAGVDVQAKQVRVVIRLKYAGRDDDALRSRTAQADGRREQDARRADLVVRRCVLGEVKGKDVLGAGDGDDGILRPETGVLAQDAVVFLC
ncbi:hypothetical protein MAC_02179 [Metarhizium acridum CQMa 102]|uniref:Uncharacterized protein n=1 Tax=Metarhizium acridum (strain CQMa 102) TaxID=655827 RepID=E9DX31_METAQ|nr:uncharacterized protein MAC_02179 [Metarhizium acridum CQMa 102]EFY91894.1 hypothetical protein MAC_02179 [Metarhizium acridum CQMa 102]